MALRFYNTLGREKQDFKPISAEEVTLYTCGPTVYNHVHIGNLRAMVSYDLAKRYLKYKGYKIKHVMNITDVDDKTIRDSQKQGKSLKEFTESYTQSFLEDLKALNIDLPPEDMMPKATEEIDEMVKLVKILLEKGFAYRAENGDIYFSISKFEDYGKLALLDKDKLKKNADGRLDNSDEYEKEDARDFALWKAWDEEDGDVFWETEIGKGRPGWHIECSAMSAKYLGQPFDIHMGGVDLIFPHHTNEIAQSEAAYGKRFCNYWMHNAHLIVNGEKMSKSLGNFYTLKDLLDKGYDPKAVRYELLATHYRQKLDFREDNLRKIPDTLQRFYDFLDRLDEADGGGAEVESIISRSKEGFEKAMDDDLNISAGLASIFDLMSSVNKVMGKLSKEDAAKVKQAMDGFDSVLGFMKHEKEDIPGDIKEMADKRLAAKKEKDFETADKLRSEINSRGFIVEDKPEGYRIKKR